MDSYCFFCGLLCLRIFLTAVLATFAIERNIMYLRYFLLLMYLSFFYITTPIRRKAFNHRRKRLFKRTRFKTCGTVYTNASSILCIVFFVIGNLAP